MTRVLAIDPGRAKCGIAVVSNADGVLTRAIAAPDDIPSNVANLVSKYAPEIILIGSGTGAQAVISSLKEITTRIEVVDERLTTQKARLRYFKENPRRGWRRLIPIGLLTPPQPYDDYAAVVLAELFLEGSKGFHRASG